MKQPNFCYVHQQKTKEITHGTKTTKLPLDKIVEIDQVRDSKTNYHSHLSKLGEIWKHFASNKCYFQSAQSAMAGYLNLMNLVANKSVMLLWIATHNSKKQSAATWCIYSLVWLEG